MPLGDDSLPTRSRKLVAAYKRAFPSHNGMEMALDFFEAGVLERDEALAIIGTPRRREFSHRIVERRRARRRRTG
jgi:hypothetical protein